MAKDSRQSDIVDEAFAGLRRSQLPTGPSPQVLEQILRAVTQTQEKPERFSIIERIRNMNKFVKYSAAASVAIAATVAAIVISRGAGGDAPRPVAPPVVAAVSPAGDGDLAIVIPPADEPPPTELMAVYGPGESFAKSVRDTPVIVVAVPLDYAPAPPNAPGDGPEVFIRWKVIRIIKGQLADQIITVREASGMFEQFVGKEWIILLSPDYLAGKFPFASIGGISIEPEILAILGKAPVRVEPGQKAQTGAKVSPNLDKKPKPTALPAVKK
jgi:hypothetical protein